MQFLVPGIDMFTAPLVPASFDQLVRAASFYTAGGIGGVIVSDTAPDVVTNPELATFLWLESVASIPNGNVYYFNGTTWESLLTFDGAQITNGTITANKLSIAGANAFDILQVNSGATAFVLTNIMSAIQNGTLTLNKILAAPGPGYFLSSDSGGVTAWQTIATALVNNSIPVNKLALGPDRNIIISDGVFMDFATPEYFIATALNDGSIPLDKLFSTGAVGGQSIRRRPTNTSWEFYTPAGAPVTSYALIVDTKAANTAGGTFTNGATRTRDLNTIVTNQDGIISALAANQFTFGVAGTYRIYIKAPANDVDRHQASLYKVTTAAVVATGTSEDTSNTSDTTTSSIVQCVVTVTAGDKFEVQHICSTTKNTTGFGAPANLGLAELYTTVEIQRLS